MTKDLAYYWLELPDTDVVQIFEYLQILGKNQRQIWKANFMFFC